jgi:hypothetical protein
MELTFRNQRRGRRKWDKDNNRTKKKKKVGAGLCVICDG